MIFSSQSSDELKQKAVQSRSEFVHALKDEIKRSTEEREIIVRILLNDQHWFQCIIHLDEGNTNVHIDIIDTIQKAMKLPLDQIKEEFQKICGDVINQALSEVMESPSLLNPSENIEYSQGLQYGEMGCGFTTDLNLAHLLENDFFLEETRVKTTDRLVETVMHTMEVEGMGTIEYTEDLVNRELSVDRSWRSPLRFAEEVCRRADFHVELQKRESIKKELARHFEKKRGLIPIRGRNFIN